MTLPELEQIAATYDFASVGMSVAGYEEEKNGEILQVLLRNRHIHVSAWFQKIKDGRGAFNATIGLNRKPGEGYLLSDYFNHHGRRMSADKRPDEPWPDFVRRALELLLDFLKNEIPDVVSGAKWEEIPFDWGDYK